MLIAYAQAKKNTLLLKLSFFKLLSSLPFWCGCPNEEKLNFSICYTIENMTKITQKS